MRKTPILFVIPLAGALLSACQQEQPASEAPAPETVETPAASPQPDPGMLVLETAESLDAYRRIMRRNAAAFCTWRTVDGDPRPVFYREESVIQILESFSSNPDMPSEEDLELYNSLIAEVDPCVRVRLPSPANAEDPPPAPDLEGQRYFRIDSLYDGMPLNMFTLVERYAHPITFVCPLETTNGSSVIIAYDDSLTTTWSDDIPGAFDTNFEECKEFEA
mgnify:CR=1 FL=1